ncbi:MAG: ATP-binding cassette domain-containing protein [Nitriliruptorales bacterium]|nr:ATP-binding cassette domain-containing protein [Nitriliruptorales bacterium]
MSASPTVSRAGVLRRGLRVLGSAIRTEPRAFAVSLSGAVLYAAMTVASATVFGAVTDRVIVPAFREGATTTGALVGAAAALLAVSVLKAIGVVTRRFGAWVMQLRLHARYRRSITQQYQALPMSWHQQHSTGSLLSNATADVDAAFWPIAPLPLSCGVLVMLAVTAGLLLATDIALAAVGFLVGPVIALLNWRYNRAVQGPATAIQERRSDVSGVAHESFDGALVVKTLGREAAETQRFEHESQGLRDELIRYGRLRAIFDPLMEAVPNVGVLLVLVVGVWRIRSGLLTEGEVVQFAYLFTLLAFPIRAIGWVLSDMPRSVVGWERVQRVLQTSVSSQPDGLEEPTRSGPAATDLIGVAFRYDEAAVLRGVSFRADPGKTIAVVGPTGSGKSTIASLLVRLADPEEGAVRLDGHDLRTLTRGSVSRSAAIVFQHSFLFDDTIRENITLGDEFDDDEVWAACDLAQASGFIRGLGQGLDTVVGERGTSLSGGQRQRLALARALVRRPRLLIMDDATSSVDTTVEEAILRGLKSAALPSTIVVVAYRQATIALADQIVFIEQGEVAATGSHQELLERVPAYERLVTAYADARPSTPFPGEPPAAHPSEEVRR